MFNCIVQWPNPNQIVWINLHNLPYLTLVFNIIPHKTEHSATKRPDPGKSFFCIYMDDLLNN